MAFKTNVPTSDFQLHSYNSIIRSWVYHALTHFTSHEVSSMKARDMAPAVTDTAGTSSLKRKRRASWSNGGRNVSLENGQPIITTCATADDIASSHTGHTGHHGVEEDISRLPAVTSRAIISLTAATPEPTLAFYIGSEVRRIQQSRFLPYVWGNGLDSDCLACGEEFTVDASPLVRTIGFEYSASTESSMVDITQTALAPHPIRVYNRHLACIEANEIDFIPVSHAWHEAVARAQDRQTPNLQASFLAYQVPVKTLLAATKKYGPVEIWHDYMSVPQWRKEIQQQLLLAIPAIYHYPQSIIMHLDDVPGRCLAQTYEDKAYSSFLEGLAATIRSRWFDRMWVTLEYIQGNEILMLSEEYDISDVNASDLSLRISNVAARYVKRHGHGKFMKDVVDQGCRWVKNVNWTDMESWKKPLDKHHTFGVAVHILGLKKCREPRDYYVALGGMTGFTFGTPRELLQFDPFHCYVALALHVLRAGDYTPLLLNPIPGEEQDARAPWLRGHSKMSEWLWDLGVCHKKANSLLIIMDNMIQPKLASVGVIEWFENRRFHGKTEEVFMDVACQIIRSSGTEPVAFCDAVDRIFARTDMKALYTGWDTSDARRTAAAAAAPPYDHRSLETLLNEFSIVQYSTQTDRTRAQLLDWSKRMIKMLQLDKPGKKSADSRLSMAQAEAQWYMDRYGFNMEGLARVACKFCAQRALFRLTLWEEPKLGVSQVYRIPGLLFDETIPDGVGLVVGEGNVIGKMIYGTPACACDRSERVDLGPVIG